jgi:hypothetical protein
MGVPAEVVRLAAQQGGYVRRSQLLELGYSESAIDRRLTTEDIKPVVASVYQVFPSSDHLDLIRGACLALPSAVASHETAAHLLEFPILPTLVPTVTVPSNTTHRFPGVTVRRGDDFLPEHLTWFGGLPITSTTRTVFDLAAVIHPRQFDRIAEALILADRMSLEELQAVAQAIARRGKPGSRVARNFVESRAGTHPRSTKLERIGRDVLSAGGLPSPTPQYPVPWDLHKRFDDAYPEAKVAIEWDSRAWHSQRGAMTADRRRDREAVSHGWVVLRFTWEDLEDKPGDVVSTVASLLERR